MDEYDYRRELHSLDNGFSRPDLILLTIWLGLIAADLIAGLAQSRALADQAVYLVATLAVTAGTVAAFVGAVRADEHREPAKDKPEAHGDNHRLGDVYDIDTYNVRNAA